MHSALPHGSRRWWALALSLCATALALALPAASRAAESQSCYGSVKQIKPTADRDTGAAYEFSCKSSVTGFALVSTSEIASFDVSADVFTSPAEGSTLRGDDRFGECEGDLPGFGFHCAGTYTGIGRFVRATFDGVESPCARDKSRHVIARYSLIVANGAGRVSGPYDLGRTQGCPKPKKAKKHKKHKKS
jgi:hypothetical protein